MLNSQIFHIFVIFFLPLAEIQKHLLQVILVSCEQSWNPGCTAFLMQIKKKKVVTDSKDHFPVLVVIKLNKKMHTTHGGKFRSSGCFSP